MAEAGKVDELKPETKTVTPMTAALAAETGWPVSSFQPPRGRFREARFLDAQEINPLSSLA